jgi:hypothetical protein
VFVHAHLVVEEGWLSFEALTSEAKTTSMLWHPSGAIGSGVLMSATASFLEVPMSYCLVVGGCVHLVWIPSGSHAFAIVLHCTASFLEVLVEGGWLSDEALTSGASPTSIGCLPFGVHPSMFVLHCVA